jgi:hypothetical protein
MIQVFAEVEAGSRDQKLYDEATLQYRETRRVMQPYPFPYGFVLGTRCEDGECVDCYILTSERLKAGTTVSCQPVNLDRQLHETLRSFIQGVFRALPDVTVHVGRILPKERALEYLRKHTSEQIGTP